MKSGLGIQAHTIENQGADGARLVCYWRSRLQWIRCFRLGRPRSLHDDDLRWKSLNLEIDAGDLRTAISLLAARALAKFGEPDVAALAEFQPRRNHDRVDVDTGLPLEFEQHVHPSGV